MLWRLFLVFLCFDATFAQVQSSAQIGNIQVTSDPTLNVPPQISGDSATKKLDESMVFQIADLFQGNRAIITFAVIAIVIWLTLSAAHHHSKKQSAHKTTTVTPEKSSEAAPKVEDIFVTPVGKRGFQLWTEFKTFAFKDDAWALAVALMISRSLETVVSSVANDLLKPFVALAMTKSLSFESLFVVLRAGTSGTKTYPSRQAAIADGAVVMNVGQFLSICLTFFITALVLFGLMKVHNTAQTGIDGAQSALATWYDANIRQLVQADIDAHHDSVEEDERTKLH